MKTINDIITETNKDSQKLYYIMHIVKGEESAIEEASYEDLLSNNFWEETVFMGAGDGDWSDIIEDCKRTFYKGDYLMYEGDAGFVLIVTKKGIRKL